jgi:hypothetical protein
LECAKTVLDENSLVTVPHPPDSAVLVPPGFWLFAHINPSLAGRVFNGVDALLEAVIRFLIEIQPYELQPVSHHWVEWAK